MGSIGAGEIVLIFLIALLLFGPGRLPEIGRALGKAAREFRKAESEVRSAMTGREDGASEDPAKSDRLPPGNGSE